MNDTQALLDSIAYVVWHGHTVIAQDAGSVQIGQPQRTDLLNYAGATHAGAMYTLAETASGVAADSVARPLGAFILLRGAEVQYTRRASSALVARAQADESARRVAARRFRENGRADLSIAAVIYDSEEQPVFEGHFHYAFRPRAL